MDMGKSDDWIDCPEGMITDLAGRLRRRRHRRLVVKAAGSTSAAVVLLGAGAIALTPSPQVPQSQVRLHCSEVVRLAPQFKAQLLSDEIRLQVVDHLNDCRACRSRYEQMGIT